MDQSTILALVYLFVVPLLAIGLGVLLFLQWRKAKRIGAEKSALEERFKPILDQEAEVRVLQEAKAKLNASIADLKNDYSEKKAIHDRLLKQVAVFDDRWASTNLISTIATASNSRQRSCGFEKPRKQWSR